MRILSIDPGVEKVGYALFEKQDATTKKFAYVTSGLIKTDRKYEHEVRLKMIYESLKKVIEDNSPSFLIIERLFFYNNQKTVIGVGQAQGVILLLAAQYNLKVVYLTPLQIKAAITGYGNADKKAVQKMLPLLLNQEIPKCEDDQSDAIACGLAFCSMNTMLLKS